MTSIHNNAASSSTPPSTPSSLPNPTNANRNKNADQKKPPSLLQSSHRFQTLFMVAIHILCIAIYIIPLRTHAPRHVNVLDEIHILGEDQADVVGTSSLYDVFTNDYWGRPMSKVDSHKSYRPASILSFRYLKPNFTSTTTNDQYNYFNLFQIDPVFFNRLIGVIIHAACAELVSIHTVSLFQSSSKHDQTSMLLLRIFSKLLFALHPTHVKTVANAANRPHVLAVFCSMIMVDAEGVHLLVLIMAVIFGLLCSETAIFQIPAVLLTMTVISWKKRTTSSREDGNDGGEGDGEGGQKRNWSSLFDTMMGLLPRYFVIVFLTAAYLCGRVVLKTTDIPEGLIRPAENPFYEFTGLKRVLSYSLVLSIHVGKAFLVDYIGFSHEYGYNCLPEVTSIHDTRLYMPLFVIATVLILLYYTCVRKRNLESFVMCLVGLSWMATLFPISGVLKVGTFIADRIVIASTVAFAMFGARFLVYMVTFPTTNTTKEPPSGSRNNHHTRKYISNVLLVGCLFCTMMKITMKRSVEWMTPEALLISSLKSCPNSAKSNLESSKLYSHDPALAKSYVERAEEIDPTYCDIHWQMASILFKQNDYIPMEDRLTKAVLCPFTMGNAVNFYQQYWQAVTGNTKSGMAAMQRKIKHDEVIKNAVEEDQKKRVAKEGNKGGNEEL